MHFNILTLLFITSSIQAAIQAFLILIKKSLQLHQVLLIGILIILAVENSVSFIWDSSLLNFKPYLIYFTFSFVLGLGPTIYFYTQALIKPGFVFKAKYLIHYIPILIDLAGYQANFGYNPIIRPGLSFGYFMNNLGDLALVISVFTYLYLSVLAIKRHKKLPAEVYAPSVRLLYGIFAGVGLITALWAIYLIGLKSSLLPARLSYTIYVMVHVLLAVILYWLGLKGMLFFRPVLSRTIGNTSDPDNATTQKEEDFFEECSKIIGVLEKEKIYLDPQLDLNSLAKKVGIQPKQLSHVLNNHLGKNFTQLLNEYRICEIKEKLAGGEYAHLTIISIAFDCGFNSKTTFNRVFKQSTGMTAKEYVKHIQKERDK